MALAYRTRPGDVDRLVADDVAVVRRQLGFLAAEAGNRRVLADQVAYELTLLLDAEHRVLGESGETARAMAELLVTIGQSAPGEADFEDALSQLDAAFQTFAAAQEGDFLPRVRETSGPARVAELGREYLAAKRAAPTHPHLRIAGTGVGHPAAAVFDRIRDSFSGRSRTLTTDPSGTLDPQAQRLADVYSSLLAQPPEILEADQAGKQPTPADAVTTMVDQDGLPGGPELVGDVDTVPAGPVPLRVYHPTGTPTDALPVLLWISDELGSPDASCRALVNKTGVVVVSPTTPPGYDDVLAAYRWLQEHAAEIGGDPTTIAVGGEGFGATIAAATCWQLAQSGEPMPVAQVLVSPLTTVDEFGESMADAADARPLNRPVLSWRLMHTPDFVDDPRTDLLSVPGEELAGLPPALVIVAERDPLRSQGEEYAAHLAAAAVPTTVTRYDGVMHGFFGASAVLDKADAAQREAARHLLASVKR